MKLFKLLELLTTYKAWFDSGGVLNEWELEWEKMTKKEGRKCKKNRHRPYEKKEQET